MVETVTAQTLPLGASGAASVKGLEPGAEIKAKVEANLPGGIVRLETASGKIDLRVASPLPAGTNVSVQVSGTKQNPTIEISSLKTQGQTSQPGQQGAAPQGTVAPTQSGPVGPGLQGGLVRTNPALSTLLQTGTSPSNASGTLPNTGAGLTPASGQGVSPSGSAPVAAKPQALQANAAKPQPSGPVAPSNAGGASQTASVRSQAPLPGGIAHQPAGQPSSGASGGVPLQSGAPVSSTPTVNPVSVHSGPGQAATTSNGLTSSSAAGRPVQAAANATASTLQTGGAGRTVGGLSTAPQGAGQPSAAPSSQSGVPPATTTPQTPAQTLSPPQPATAPGVSSGASQSSAPQAAGGQPVQALGRAGGQPGAEGLSRQTSTGQVTGSATTVSQPGAVSAQTPTGAGAASSSQAPAQGAMPPNQSAQVSQAGGPAQSLAGTGAQARTASPSDAGGGSRAPQAQPSSPGRAIPAQPYQASQAAGSPIASTAPNTSPLPQTPLQEVASALKAPLTDQQAGLGNLFAQVGTLAAAQSAGKISLPDPVVKAMQQILGLRLNTTQTPSAKDLQQSVRLSGQFREAQMALPQGGAQPLPDLKSVLLSFRSLLQQFGAEAQATRPATQPAVPSRQSGPTPQAQQLTGGFLSSIALQNLQALLKDTDSALARIRLTQLVNSGATADEGSQVSSRPMDVVVELPLSLGQETAILQMQIGRDGGGAGEDDENEDAWRLRFSLDLTATGPLEAAISLRGGGTYASLWIDRKETYDDLNAVRDTMEAAFADAGLDLQELRLVRGLLPRTAAGSGAIVNKQS